MEKDITERYTAANGHVHSEPKNNFAQEKTTEESQSTGKVTASKRKLEAHHDFNKIKRPNLVDNTKVHECKKILSQERKKEPKAPVTGYRLVDIEMLGSVMSDAHKCTRGKLHLKEEYLKRYGLKSSLYLECSKCKRRTFLPTSGSVSNAGKSFDVNRRAVYYALESGIGFSGLEKFTTIFNSECLSKQSYYKHVDSIVDVLSKETEEELREAGNRLRKLLISDNPNITDDSILDTTVSFDGTWAKRGHTSFFGIVYVISVDSGEVLDYEVLSKFCKVCSDLELKRKTEPENHEAEMAKHLQSGLCDINYEGSSNAMEVEGALRIWQRSLEKHNMRYIYMVSDGDSKAYTKVSESQCYGEGIKIEKIDCIGHVQKRMGKRLLNLKSITKGKIADGKSIGGRGRLSDPTIKRIQRYYGLAIRQNTTESSYPSEADRNLAVYQMKKNVMAILSHTITTKDVTLQHRYCPVGKESWCAWQRDKASGTFTYNAKYCLPEVFMDLLKPIFVDLSNDGLLKRCAIGATQNPNECINSLVWLRCPKHMFHGANVVKYAAAAAVMQFNGGFSMGVRIMESLGTPVTQTSALNLYKKDKQRIQKAEKTSEEKEKKKRVVMQQLRTVREEAYKEIEGVSYESGGF